MKIAIENLSYKNKTILENTKMVVEEGDFVNVIGQNGSGKSSFFKALLGMISYQGMIEIAPSEIAVISDYARVPKELRVCDIVSFLGKMHPQGIGELVGLLGLDRILDSQIARLSSGERRKVEIFTALSSEKKVIVYDEIMNALDMGVKRELLEFIKSYHSNNRKIAFYTSHDLSESFYLGGKYWFLNPIGKNFEDLSCETQDYIMKKYVMGGDWKNAF